jgi:hypothetical protein
MGSVHVEPLRSGVPVRRSKAGFWMAAVVAAAGVVAAAVWATLGALAAAGSTEDFARTDLPGTVTVRVTEPQALVVYFEGDPVPDLDRLALRVTGPADRPVRVRPYDGYVRYDSPVAPGIVGTAVATFDAERGGTYRVDSPLIGPAVGQGGARFAVGEDVAGGFVANLVGPAALVVGSLLAASAIALATAVRINGSYRRSREGSAR